MCLLFWSGRFKVEAVVAFHSMCALLGIKQAAKGSIESKKELVKNSLKDFKSNLLFYCRLEKVFQPLTGTEFKI